MNNFIEKYPFICFLISIAMLWSAMWLFFTSYTGFLILYFSLLAFLIIAVIYLQIKEKARGGDKKNEKSV